LGPSAIAYISWEILLVIESKYLRLIQLGSLTLQNEKSFEIMS